MKQYFETDTIQITEKIKGAKLLSVESIESNEMLIFCFVKEDGSRNDLSIKVSEMYISEEY